MSYSSNPYYTYEKIDSTLQKWNDQFGSDESVNFPGKGIIFQLDTIGFSTQLSLPIFAVKISDNAPEIEDEIKVLILGQCHAEEVYGVEISMAIIDCFLNPNTCYQNQYIKSNFSPILNSSLENVELWVVPTHNPEGLKVVHGFEDAHGNWIEDASYRKNLRDANENDIFDWTAGIGQDFDGVDLNRNYNINWQFGDTLLQKTSSCNPYYNDDFDYYKGSHPFSESETQAIKDFTLKHNFSLSIAYHSSRSGCVAEKIIFPWGWKEKGNLDEYRKYSPDYPVIHSLATQMNTILGFSSIEGIKPQGSRTGNAHDWLYRETGCIQYLIEVGNFDYG
ncbi:MAG: M14 family zinc carboxypeptidase, partial [Candidatus Marinimicrobia bacterium]|nr:M14 family zinc carboxypeptidase [Candidatus Neomarinimicrobiota bacterium]